MRPHTVCCYLLKPKGSVVNWHLLEQHLTILEQHLTIPPKETLTQCWETVLGQTGLKDKYSEKLRTLYCKVAAKYCLTFIVFPFLVLYLLITYVNQNSEITHISATYNFQCIYFAYSYGIVTYIGGIGMCFYGKIQ